MGSIESQEVPPGPPAVSVEGGAGVVHIRTQTSRGFGAGTGMVISATGEILTNNHVISGATQIQVTVAPIGRSYTATVVGADPVHDIAVLRLAHAAGLTPVSLGNSERVRLGDPVKAIGNPGARGSVPAVSPGTVIGLDRQITATDLSGHHTEELAGLIQVEALVLPGDSGGPLADAAGDVIGLNTAASTTGSGSTSVVHKGYAIPINVALRIARELVAMGDSGVVGRAH